MKKSSKAKKPKEIEDLEGICNAVFNDKSKGAVNPEQKQNTQPGIEKDMHPRPVSIFDDYQASGKLTGKTILITGGDSGLGRSIVYHCIAEGANIAFVYLNEHQDAQETYHHAKMKGGNILEPISANLSKYSECQRAVDLCIKHFGVIDVLINNIAIQFFSEDFSTLNLSRLKKLFSCNVYSYFYMTQLTLPYLKKGASIINTTSVTAYRGSEHLIDYSASKGAIVSFTRSLAKQLMDKEIRVNAVAPGPVWTPLIPASFPEEKVSRFGGNTIYNRPAEPAEIAPSYIFLASSDSRFMTGQVLHPNGGEIINT